MGSNRSSATCIHYKQGNFPADADSSRINIYRMPAPQARGSALFKGKYGTPTARSVKVSSRSRTVF